MITIMLMMMNDATRIKIKSRSSSSLKKLRRSLGKTVFQHCNTGVSIYMQNFLVLEKSAKDINRRKGNAKMRFKSIRCFCPICMRNIISSFEGVVRKNSINQLIQKCTFYFCFLKKKHWRLHVILSNQENIFWIRKLSCYLELGREGRKVKMHFPTISEG